MRDVMVFIVRGESADDVGSVSGMGDVGSAIGTVDVSMGFGGCMLCEWQYALLLTMRLHREPLLVIPAHWPSRNLEAENGATEIR